MKKKTPWTKYNKYWAISFGLWFAFFLGWIISGIKDSITYMRVFNYLQWVCLAVCIICLILDRKKVKGGKKRR